MHWFSIDKDKMRILLGNAYHICHCINTIICGFYVSFRIVGSSKYSRTNSSIHNMCVDIILYYIHVACFVCLHSFHGVIWCGTLVQFELMKFLTSTNSSSNMISKFQSKCFCERLNYAAHTKLIDSIYLNIYSK